MGPSRPYAQPIVKHLGGIRFSGPLLLLATTNYVDRPHYPCGILGRTHPSYGWPPNFVLAAAFDLRFSMYNILAESNYGAHGGQSGDGLYPRHVLVGGTMRGTRRGSFSDVRGEGAGRHSRRSPFYSPGNRADSVRDSPLSLAALAGELT